jgi:peptidoglycan-N-acetylglucosamine deacetylase
MVPERSGQGGQLRRRATYVVRRHHVASDQTMDDGPSIPGSSRRRGFPAGAQPGSLAPHYRRRRGFAVVVVLAILALIVGVIAGGGPGITARRLLARGPTGYFTRLRTLAGNGSASMATAEQTDEDGAIDRTLAYTPYVRVAGTQHREVALTFDDGPGPYTPQIVSVLERENVPATFFEVGVLERYFHAATSEIVARGYPIGDHTQSHAPMSKLNAKAQQSQLLQETSLVGDYGAPFPRLFRPPYGLWNSTTLKLLHRYRMLMVLWTVDTGDYREPGTAAIVESAVDGARPGAIILLHDAGGNRSETVAALPEIAHALKARGYRLVTVPRLLLDNPAPRNQAVASLQGAGG